MLYSIPSALRISSSSALLPRSSPSVGRWKTLKMAMSATMPACQMRKVIGLNMLGR